MGPTFVRFQNLRGQAPNSPWWLVMGPGLALIAFGVSILIWPELLAYMVAFIILSIGVTVTGWGWRLRQLGRHQKSPTTSRGNVQQETYGHQGIFSPEENEQRASDATVYYDRQP